MKIFLSLVPLFHLLVAVQGFGCDLSGEDLIWGEMDFTEEVSDHCSSNDVDAVHDAAQEAVQAMNVFLGSGADFDLQAPQSMDDRRSLLRGRELGRCNSPMMILFGLCRRRLMEKDGEAQAATEASNRKLELEGDPCPEAVTLFLDSAYFPQKLLDKKASQELSQGCYDFLHTGIWDFDAYVNVEED